MSRSWDFSEAFSFLLGTTAVHICGQEKQILCRTIPFACGLSLAFGLFGCACASFLHVSY